MFNINNEYAIWMWNNDMYYWILISVYSFILLLNINLLILIVNRQCQYYIFDIDVEYLEILKDSGFDQIVFPVESASKRILKLYATSKINLERMDLPLLI